MNIARSFSRYLRPPERGTTKYAVAILALTLFVSLVNAAEFEGRTDRIVDGDTFWLCDAATCTKIRLCGIDAPEIGDPRAAAATAALTALLRGQVRCVQVGAGTPCDGRSAPIGLLRSASLPVLMLRVR